VSIRNDHDISRRGIDISEFKVGDLVWWGSVDNIGNCSNIGIIVTTDFNHTHPIFGGYNTSYGVLTCTGVIETNIVFPL
jgi:hypothetical protein